MCFATEFTLTETVGGGGGGGMAQEMGLGPGYLETRNVEPWGSSSYQ